MGRKRNNPASKSLRKDVHKMLRVAERQGCAVHLGRGHYKVRCPGGLVTVSSSPSKQGAVHAIRRDLGRAGVVFNPAEVTYRLPIGYDVFNIFQRYWWGQGDPLYAVLSRRGTSVDWVTVEASQEEVDRLWSVAEEIVESSTDESERRVARAFMQRFRGQFGENPLTRWPPPRYLYGGMGSPEIWEYEGIEIVVTERYYKGGAEWQACFVDIEGDKRCAGATERDAAIANARYAIDLASMPQPWQRAENVVQQALDHYVDTTDEPINRGRLARHLEILFRAPDPRYPFPRGDYQAFYDLPLPDRLRLLDAVLDMQEDLGLFDPSRRIPNPGDPVGVRAELLAW